MLCQGKLMPACFLFKVSVLYSHQRLVKGGDRLLKRNVWSFVFTLHCYISAVWKSNVIWVHLSHADWRVTNFSNSSSIHYYLVITAEEERCVYPPLILIDVCLYVSPRATRLFCDVYNPQSKTYCKRLQVLCPEHSRDPKVSCNANRQTHWFPFYTCSWYRMKVWLGLLSPHRPLSPIVWTALEIIGVVWL